MNEWRESNQSVAIFVQSLTCTHKVGEEGRTLYVATCSRKTAVVECLPPCGQLMTPVLEPPQENNSGKREKIIPRSEEGLGMRLGIHTCMSSFWSQADSASRVSTSRNTWELRGSSRARHTCERGIEAREKCSQ